VVFALAAGWLGLTISYEASVHHGVRLASGATIVVVMTIGFALVLAADAMRAAIARARS
jgi:manganese/iron transport system permease protein